MSLGKRHDVRECLGRLPGNVREIIDARYYDDKNATDIGDEFAMTKQVPAYS